MKFLTSVLFLVGFATMVHAQKENNVWVGGQKTGLDFNSDNVEVFQRDSTMWIDVTNASICDKNGRLMFYTNGYRVYDSTLHLMENGNHLEIGDYESWSYGFNAVPDGAGILPMPGDSNKYYLFHVDFNNVTGGGLSNWLMPTHLFYSVVDMTLNNGWGAVVSGAKNVPILNDTLTGCGFKMVKHANGRDYWLICHEYNADNYYRFLIDPSGIHGPYSQHIGYAFSGLNAVTFSTLHFNESATMVAQLSVDSTAFLLYDFDRCTGEFSNVRNVKVSDSLYRVTGGAFSPSDQYFYVASRSFKYIWQFDVTVADVFASRKVVANYSGALNPFQTNYYQMRLAPNGKIYCHAYDFNFSIHVINHPDSSGVACGFVENALQIQPPGWVWQGFPNIVNYHLGPVAGSSCDSLVSVAPFVPTFTWSVYPNPFVDQINLSITGVATKAFVTITNVFGQQVFSETIATNNNRIHHTVDMTSFASGVYFVIVQTGENRYHQAVVKK